MLHSNTSTVTFLEKTHLPSYEPPLTWTFSNQSPLDNFLWGYLKDRIYANDLQTIDALKHYIRTEIRIPHELLHRVITDLNVRVVTATQWFPLWFKYLRTHRFTKPEIFELSSVVDNWEFTTRIRNHYKNARALKKRKVIESLPADWWIISIANQVLMEVLRICGKELPDDQHSRAGGKKTSGCAESQFYWAQARSQFLRFRGQNTCSGERFLFYYMIETNFSGHNKIWGTQKIGALLPNALP